MVISTTSFFYKAYAQSSGKPNIGPECVDSACINTPWTIKDSIITTIGVNGSICNVIIYWKNRVCDGTCDFNIYKIKYSCPGLNFDAIKEACYWHIMGDIKALFNYCLPTTLPPSGQSYCDSYYRAVSQSCWSSIPFNDPTSTPDLWRLATPCGNWGCCWQKYEVCINSSGNLTWQQSDITGYPDPACHVAPIDDCHFSCGFPTPPIPPSHNKASPNTNSNDNNKLEIAKLQVSPNPTKGKIGVIFINENNSYKLEIYNSKGDIVQPVILSKSTNNNSTKIEFDVSKLSSGKYFVKVITDAATLQESFNVIK